MMKQTKHKLSQMQTDILSSSFRDPSGFLFSRDGEIYRQINKTYQANYDYLISSGLYQKLIDKRLLIPHQEVDIEPLLHDTAYKVIQPERIEFISYPFEWCFTQLQDAALITLRVQNIALQYGMSLKDSSSYNIQFHNGKPLLIDTLSFEIYKEGQPWIAYRQFCQHFLAPLSLMAYKDFRLNQLLRDYIDGLPLDLTSRLLPAKTRLNFPVLMHIHTHAASQKRMAGKELDSKGKMSRTSFLGLLDSLESSIRKLKWQPSGTEWGEYYQDNNYSVQGFKHKQKLVGEYLDVLNPKRVWDLGANVGIFSRLASERGAFTIAFDSDQAAVEKNYLKCRQDREKNLLPLIIDLINPSPNIGWANRERMTIVERGPADTILALALIHHLAISNNVPLDRICKYFRSLGNSLIIEFVPKDDSQVKRLLVSREDIFADYTRPAFENIFSRQFDIRRAERVQDSSRHIYLMVGR